MDIRILCVDDDQNILNGIKRNLRKYEIDTALNGDEGLEAVKRKGPYAVIVSDMRMPGIGGIEFLANAKIIAPDSVRIMLTGYADINSAIEAVNEGNIFRLLTKPCLIEDFEKALQAGVAQYRLIMAERDLLEKTLSRSVKVLVDLLSMINPSAFSRTTRIRRYVKHIISEFPLQNSWQIELASILCQVGCVTIPPDTIEKYYSNQPLTDSENGMFNIHPKIGAELLAKIPRLELVALMIEKQLAPFVEFGSTLPPLQRDEADLGAQILKAAIEYDKLVSSGLGYAKATDELMRRSDECDPLIVAKLRTIGFGGSDRMAGTIRICDLAVGMTIEQNIYSTNRLLLVPKGQEVTFALSERIKNFWKNNLIDEHAKVLFSRQYFKESLTVVDR